MQNERYLYPFEVVTATIGGVKRAQMKADMKPYGIDWKCASCGKVFPRDCGCPTTEEEDVARKKEWYANRLKSDGYWFWPEREKLPNAEAKLYAMRFVYDRVGFENWRKSAFPG